MPETADTRKPARRIAPFRRRRCEGLDPPGTGETVGPSPVSRSVRGRTPRSAWSS